MDLGSWWNGGLIDNLLLERRFYREAERFGAPRVLAGPVVVAPGKQQLGQLAVGPALLRIDLEYPAEGLNRLFGLSLVLVDARGLEQRFGLDLLKVGRCEEPLLLR